MAESKMPALDGLTAIDRLRLFATDPETFSFDIDDAEAAVAKYDELAARADLVEPLVEALEHCQSALAMIISPDAINSTSVLHAFAQATEAECKARAAILRARQAAQSGQAQTEARRD